MGAVEQKMFSMRTRMTKIERVKPNPLNWGNPIIVPSTYPIWKSTLPTMNQVARFKMN